MPLSISDLTSMRFDIHDRDEFFEDSVSRGLGDDCHVWFEHRSGRLLAACGAAFSVDDANVIPCTSDEPAKGYLTLTVHEDLPDYTELLETHPHVVGLSLTKLEEAHEEHGLIFDMVEWLKANIGPTAVFEEHEVDDAVVYDVGVGALAAIRHDYRADYIGTDCHAPMLDDRTSTILFAVAKVYFFKTKKDAALFMTFWG